MEDVIGTTLEILRSTSKNSREQMQQQSQQQPQMQPLGYEQAEQLVLQQQSQDLLPKHQSNGLSPVPSLSPSNQPYGSIVNVPSADPTGGIGA